MKTPSSELSPLHPSGTTVPRKELMPTANYNHAKEAEAMHFGLGALIWGTPLVNMERMQRDSVNGLMGKNRDIKVPPIALNKFVYRNVDKSGIEHVPAANNDSLGAMTFLDFRKEPMVLEIPRMDAERDYFFQIVNAFQTTYHYIGARTHGHEGGKYVFVGPDWQGALPTELTPIYSETNLNVMLVFFTVSSQHDLEIGTHLRSQIKLYPLNLYGTATTTPEPDWDTSIERVRVSIDPEMPKPLEFFHQLANALQYTRPPERDLVISDSFRRIGFDQDFKFDYKSLSPEQVNGLVKALETGHAMIDNEALSDGRRQRINNWTYDGKTGTFGTDYLLRAMVSKWYTFPNIPAEISYLRGRQDQNNDPLHGTNAYVIHFEDGQLPRTRGIWSLTLYDKQGYFVKNPLNRFSYQNRAGDLLFNSDGSLDIYLNNSDPGPGKNWIPAPAAEFYLLLKLYRPDDSLANGQWKPPFICKQ